MRQKPNLESIFEDEIVKNTLTRQRKEPVENTNNTIKMHVISTNPLITSRTKVKIPIESLSMCLYHFNCFSETGYVGCTWKALYLSTRKNVSS